MTAIYILTKTDPANGTITINPNTLNGPGSVTQDTNLRLYGAGSLQYGEGVNEDLLHLLEHFASPEVGSPAGTPDPTYFDPTKVVIGQGWFNTTVGKLFIYDGSNWLITGGTSSGVTPPPSPSIGDLWYDQSGSPAENQLKVLSSTGPDVWTSVADKYVLKDGGTMLADPTVALGVATKQYVDNAILSINTLDELTNVESDASATASTGDALVWNGATWDSADNYVKLAGDTMTGLLTLSGDPSTALQAATKQYADTKPTISSGAGAPGTTPGKVGDIYIDTSSDHVYISAGAASSSDWKKVFPAVYS